MKSNFPKITIASFIVYLGLIGLVGCNNPPSPPISPVPLTFKQIEAKVLRGELINDTEIKGLQSEELKRLRNTVFAKYGKVYQRPGLGDYFASCDWYKPNPNYKDSDADRLLTANDNQNVKTIQGQEDSAKLNSNSAPSIISPANIPSNKNNEAPPIQPANNTRNTPPSSDIPSTYGSKIISPEEIGNIVDSSTNDIAVESNLDAALSDRQITIKSYKIFYVERENIPDEDIAYSMSCVTKSDRNGFLPLVVVFSEAQKQDVLSLQMGATINVKCKYLGYAAGKVIFGFESFD